MRQRLRLVGLLGVGLTLFAPSHASAYCRTTTCSNREVKSRPTDCVDDPEVCETGGKPIEWPQNCLSFSVQVDGSKKFGITADQLEQVVRGSFDHWQNVSCPAGGKPNVYVETFPQVQCDQVVSNANGPNQNLWVFHDDTWPHVDNASSAIALTTMSFGSSSGRIYDADVELNSANFDFALETGSPGTDLQSVVQHESGHVLGLADLYNSSDLVSTMYFSYATLDRLDKRTLEADDAAGVCVVFPPVSSVDTSCDPGPYKGFSTQCSGPDEDGCSCSMTRFGEPSSGSRWQWLVMAGALLMGAGRRLRLTH